MTDYVWCTECVAAHDADYHKRHPLPASYPCRVCGAPITSAELCARCAVGNDPFATSKHRGDCYP